MFFFDEGEKSSAFEERAERSEDLPDTDEREDFCA